MGMNGKKSRRRLFDGGIVRNETVSYFVKTYNPVDTKHDDIICKFCKSPQIIREGKKRLSNGDVQKYQCKNCSRIFYF